MISGTTRSFGPNTVIFTPNDVPHQLELSPNSFGVTVTIDPRVPVALPTRNVFLRIPNLMDQKQVASSFDKVNWEFNASGIGRNLSVEYLVGLLAVNVARMAQKYTKGSESTAAQRLMKKFVNSLEKEYRTGRNLAGYASELGVTPTHLTRVCHQVNGKSASHLIQERILSESRAMLSHTDHKILEISNQLGFSSAAYFTRLFSVKQGQTPKEFRKNSQN